MAYLVASVSSPYDATQDSGGHPLAVGMFVEAAIRSCEVQDAIVLPQVCLESGGRVFTIDSSDRLDEKTVQVIRREGEWAVVRGDLTNDQRVCATHLEPSASGMHLERSVSGMRVKVLKDITREIPRGDDGRVLDLCGDLDGWSTDARMAEAE